MHHALDVSINVSVGDCHTLTPTHQTGLAYGWCAVFGCDYSGSGRKFYILHGT